MSSHHIIRENQEPALILLSQISDKILEQLSDWSPKIYCEYSLLDWIEEMQLKIDVVIGSEDDEADLINRLSYQMPVEFMQGHANELVDIINRIDNTTIHVASNSDISKKVFSSQKELVHFSDRHKTYLVHKNWRKWKNQGDLIEIIGNGITETKNLQMRQAGYEVIEKGMCEIITNNPILIKEHYSF